MTKAKHYATEGARTITPHLTVKGATQAIEFYKKAFGAIEKGVSKDPGGVVLHAQMQIGDSVFFLNDEFPAMGSKGPQSLGGTPVTIHLFFPDADKVFHQAVAAGAKVVMPIGDQFWGDRYGIVTDPFGHAWSIATHQEDLTPDEIMERMKRSMMHQS
jgi:PhnB protein